jgi:ELWxxDGT repeat protein
MSSQFIFSAERHPNGRELWITDGTPERTHLLVDINPGPNSSNPGSFYYQGQGSVIAAPADLVPLGDGRVLFDADDGTSGVEPWITNGTAEGTRLITDLNPGADSSYPSNFFGLGTGQAVFEANDGVHGAEPWVTDGTPEGTHLLTDVNPGSGNGTAPEGAYSSPPQSGFVTLGNGQALFAATDLAHGYEPWVTDGTREGTHLLADLNPGADNGTPPPGSTSPSQFSFLSLGDGRVLFAATDGMQGYEPWITDGTLEGTHLVRDLNPGAGSSNAFSFYDFGGGRALFAADDGMSGNELWITKGTEDSTLLLADINPGPEDSFAGVGGLAALDDQQVLFAASEGTSRDLWITNGTPEGTRLAARLDPGASSSDPRDFFSLGDGQVLFTFNTSSSGRELWVTDGTTEGTKLVADINPGAGDSFPREFVSLGNGQALFSADDGVRGQELWITDGTAEGTRLLADLNPGQQPSNPSGFALVTSSDGNDPTLGDDIITGTDAPDVLFGDAPFLFSRSGGGDQISGNEGDDFLVGDALFIFGHARGGKDVLSGGGGDDLLFGDALLMFDHAQGSHDDFAFSGRFGSDTVGDFRQGEDQLEFHVPGLNNIDDLQIALAGSNTVITAGVAGAVTLVGFTGALTEQDLLFI